MDVSPKHDGPSGLTLDKAPPHPEPRRALTAAVDEGRGKGGGGPMAATPQFRALTGLQAVQDGFRQLVSLMPDIAPQLGDLMQQLQPLVVAKVAQMTTGAGPAVPPGIMAPPPMAQNPALAQATMQPPPTPMPNPPGM